MGNGEGGVAVTGEGRWREDRDWVLCAGKDLATEQTASRMINLLRQLQQTLPPATLASTWSSLQPQQQLALQSILS
ncbi:hypothetical protein U1Q18_032024 [Sarracenia purpurea var. burkii]